jgi:hypothetical protein
LRHLLAQRVKIELALFNLRQHLVLFFLNVVLHILYQLGELGCEFIVRFLHPSKLAD